MFGDDVANEANRVEYQLITTWLFLSGRTRRSYSILIAVFSLPFLDEFRLEIIIYMSEPPSRPSPQFNICRQLCLNPLLEITCHPGIRTDAIS